MAQSDNSGKHPPSGTVTLFFADVEGSTRLIQTLGERYAHVRAKARELVRIAAAARNGYEVDWAGDGAFLAFERARDAVATAVDLQRALAKEEWPPEATVAMRIGVHTGEPDLSEEGYLGVDVHVAARICSAAHGGQIVVSRTTRDFVTEDRLEQVSFKPLGSHRLKDLGSSYQLFQLVADGVEDTFPPLHTLGGATLPALHHRLVGRRTTLAEIGTLLSRPDVRLITITGPGGAGKSRLALEAAAVAALERPVHLVGLAPICDSDLVPAAIARVVGARESASRTLTQEVADTLAGTGTLLVLDNLEHLALAVEHVRALLELVPDLDILTTSRAPLQLLSEHVVPLEPLPVDEATVLFGELAAARGVVLRDDTLPSVREICRRLDGLPLAIELVAARLVVLPPVEILRALDEGLVLEMEGPVDLPERQRTLRATIDWSYGLLTESQRELHGALSVFAGGCSLEDGRAIAGTGARFLTDLEALVGWSLLRSDVSDGGVRLSMLETVREHATARLASGGKLEELRRLHAERFLDLAVAAETELTSTEQVAWLDRLEDELDNIRGALDWCLASGRVESALQAISALERFWRARGHVSEARRWLSLGLGLAENVDRDVRADALWTAAQQATAQYDWPSAIPLLEEALELFRESGRGREVVFALSDLGFVALVQEEHERAASLCEEALEVARSLEDSRAISAALMNLADVRSVQGDHELALAQYTEAVKLRRGLGDPLLIADATYNHGIAAFRAGELARARRSFTDALALARELGETPHIAAAQFMLGELELLRGDPATSEDAIRESLRLYTELDNDRARAGCFVLLAGIAAAKGSSEEAARLLGAAAAMRGESPLNHFEATALETFQHDLQMSLGDERFAALGEEGARLGAEATSPEVVSATARE